MNASQDECQDEESAFQMLRDDADRPGPEPVGITHIEIVRVIERLHRRSLDLIRADLLQAGIDELSPSQVMMLFTIGRSELSVRDLIERGYYLGSNASYSLKRLVETAYVIRTASERDRRSARIRLSEKGRQLCDRIRQMDRTYHKLVTRDEDEVRDLEVTFRTLRRFEQVWSNAVRYRGIQAED
ncbi:MarR family transcriptional regulator [Microvirga sp. TS319]|uniref:MarR family transcriptional regulator n=1 Tax=Microvirga sp. TS319 TaxID=3241165 RepID=UPI00351AA21C